MDVSEGLGNITLHYVYVIMLCRKNQQFCKLYFAYTATFVLPFLQD